METKIKARYVDNGFGFPVVMRNVPMVKARDEWTPHIDYNLLAGEVLKMLSVLQGRLSGDQLRFIREHFEMTLQQFAGRFAVTHPAVIKWERAGSNPTGMNWSTEKDIRLFVLKSIENRPRSLFDLYNQLENAVPEHPAQVEIDAERLAA